jgi:gas vesicle protein
MIKKNWTGNLTSLCLGAAVGSAITFLMTPYSGRRIRRLMRRKLDTGRDEAARRVRQASEDLRSRGKQLAGDANKLFGT